MGKERIGPDFVVVGAAKCGTTSIDQVLRRHPEILLPRGIKETYYWMQPKSALLKGIGYREKGVITKQEDYERLYSGDGNGVVKLKGEVCNGYLYYYKNTISNLKEALGDIKIIIVLRNPVQRAFSGYLHLIRDGIIDETFRQAIEREEERIREGYWWAFHLYSVGLYCDAVSAYKANFSNVAVYLFEDFVKDPRAFYRRIFEFLEVEADYTLDVTAHANRTGLPRNPLLWEVMRRDTFVKRFAKQLLPGRLQRSVKRYMEENIVKPALDRELEFELWERYLPDIEGLSKLLGRDLVEQWRQE